MNEKEASHTGFAHTHGLIKEHTWVNPKGKEMKWP